jgi:miniconductance mechanosensitive channel
MPTSALSEGTVDAFRSWLTERGLGAEQTSWAATATAAVIVILAAILANFVAKRILLRVVKAASRRTKSTWDDSLVEARLFSRLSHLAPAVVIHLTASWAFADYPQVASAIRTGAFVYMAVVGMAVFDALLNGVLDIYQGFAISRRVHLRSFFQVVKVLVYFLGGVAILALLVGRSPLVFLSGLGAFTAILLLIFKDTILGFVAGLQLMANNMVQRGDWIEMPKHGVDGDVLDVTLMTVKVQNFDKTVSTIPTYALVTESFRNWRGMDESGGRRIKRAVNIDVSSVRFCDEELLERFRRIEVLRDYLDRKIEEVRRYNEKKQVDASLLANGRHLTNVGTFRAYLEAYLSNHPLVHHGMTCMVRQLAPGEHGLPIEIYAFSTDQRWVAYEAIQADIFDHVLAVLPLFDLRAYQAPAGADLRSLKTASGET